MKYFLILILITIFNINANNYEHEPLSDQDARFVFLSSFLKAFNYDDEFLYKFVVYYFSSYHRTQADLKRIFYHLKYRLNNNNPNFEVDQKIFEMPIYKFIRKMRPDLYGVESVWKEPNEAN
ncbi:hypothetical protein BpHYR1_039510 [Brachionus plicatilis]|uniref:Uncharacterized protein n=1 Tax=Brachionus plicatilis TaxID=10195 RepID=A0A3M7R2J9_BRAPC|nr:hypothetical protein BpHYR1_039510 [Brachionus plicatilis]